MALCILRAFLALTWTLALPAGALILREALAFGALALTWSLALTPALALTWTFGTLTLILRPAFLAATLIPRIFLPRNFMNLDFSPLPMEALSCIAPDQYHLENLTSSAVSARINLVVHFFMAGEEVQAWLTLPVQSAACLALMKEVKEPSRSDNFWPGARDHPKFPM